MPTAVVLEIGSHCIRAGFSDEFQPSRVWRSACVQAPPSNSPLFGSTLYDACCFEQDPGDISVVPLWTPNSLQTSPSLHHRQLLALCGELQILSSIRDFPVIVTPSPLLFSSEQSISALADILFDLGFPALHFVRQSVCTILGCGLPIGLVLNVGESQSTCSVVFEGLELKRTASSAPCGGHSVTSALVESLSQMNIQFTHTFASTTKRGPGGPPSSSLQSFAVQTLYEEIKQSICECGLPSLNLRLGPAAATHRAQGPTTFFAPDGASFQLDQPQLTQCFDHLFVEAALPRLVVGSLHLSDCELRSKLPLVCCGGTAHAKNFSRRLQVEVKKLDSIFHNVVPIIAEADACWRGAAMAALAVEFQPLWVSKDEYNEHGPRILTEKSA